MLLSKILSSCRPTNVTFISLETQGSKTNVDSDDYELHFKWVIDGKTFAFIKDIVTAHNLGFKDYDGRLVIYSPKKVIGNLTIV